jgi:hypothetical protein
MPRRQTPGKFGREMIYLLIIFVGQDLLNEAQPSSDPAINWVPEQRVVEK